MKSSHNMVLESWRKHSLAVSQQIKWQDVVEYIPEEEKKPRWGSGALFYNNESPRGVT